MDGGDTSDELESYLSDLAQVYAADGVSPEVTLARVASPPSQR